MVSPTEKRPGSGHSSTSLKPGCLLREGKQEPWAGGGELSSVTEEHCNLAQGSQSTG